MKQFFTALGCVALLLLFGCAEDREAVTRSHAAESHVFEDQVNAIGKARAVEEALRDSSRAQRQQIADQLR